MATANVNANTAKPVASTNGVDTKKVKEKSISTNGVSVNDVSTIVPVRRIPQKRWPPPDVSSDDEEVDEELKVCNNQKRLLSRLYIDENNKGIEAWNTKGVLETIGVLRTDVLNTIDFCPIENKRCQRVLQTSLTLCAQLSIVSRDFANAILCWKQLVPITKRTKMNELSTYYERLLSVYDKTTSVSSDTNAVTNVPTPPPHASTPVPTLTSVVPTLASVVPTPVSTALALPVLASATPTLASAVPTLASAVPTLTPTTSVVSTPTSALQTTTVTPTIATEREALVMCTIGRVSFIRKEYKLSLKYLTKSLQLYETLPHHKSQMHHLADLYAYLALAYFETNDLSKSTDMLLIVNKITGEHNNVSLWLQKMIPRDHFEKVKEALSSAVHARWLHDELLQSKSKTKPVSVSVEKSAADCPTCISLICNCISKKEQGAKTDTVTNTKMPTDPTQIEIRHISGRIQNQNRINNNTSNQSTVVHHFINCNECGNDIVGLRFHCIICSQDICSACNTDELHSQHHTLTTIFSSEFDKNGLKITSN